MVEWKLRGMLMVELLGVGCELGDVGGLSWKSLEIELVW